MPDDEQVPAEQGDSRSPDDDHVDVDDAIEVPEHVRRRWEDDDVAEGEAPSG